VFVGSTAAGEFDGDGLEDNALSLHPANNKRHNPPKQVAFIGNSLIEEMPISAMPPLYYGCN
jgi:hypothetical protein